MYGAEYRHDCLAPENASLSAQSGQKLLQKMRNRSPPIVARAPKYEAKNMNGNLETTVPPQPVRSTNDFEWLEQFLNSIHSYAPDESLILESRSVTELYHYTDLNGLQGIIDKGDLWLTHLRFSNDNDELTHGKEIVRARLEERIANDPPDRQEYLKRLKELLQLPVADGIYICCFCEKNNLLSQWRGYGANGSGVCIKFNKQAFSRLTGPDCPGGLLRLWKVFYPVEKQRKIIDKAIDYAWDTGGVSNEERTQRAAEAIQFFIPTFKNPDFAEEEEWRLIFTPTPALPVKPAFRTGRNMLIPHYGLQSLGWGDAPLPITGVCIGPGIHKEINAQSVQMLLAQRTYNGQPAYPGIIPDISKTPYRG
jgi:hypothetical protein